MRLDEKGVGGLIDIAVKKGRSVKSNLKIGICGEHGGEPNSVEFCHRQGFDYVSCSPYRIPIARVAAAQGALRDRVAIGVMAQSRTSARKTVELTAGCLWAPAVCCCRDE